MNLLWQLTLRGTLMFAVVAFFDWLCAARISARVRRAWWLLVPLAFFLTIPLAVLPAPGPSAGNLASPENFLLGVLPFSMVARATNQLAVSSLLSGAFARFQISLVVAGGAFVYLLVIVARTWSALRRWGRERLCTDAALLDVLEDCKAAANITAPIGLVVSGAVSTPVILGWLRPRILLPGALVTSLSREQLRGVLFHELAHFRSLDIPCGWFFTLACALHWFNPAAHLAQRSWTRFREEAADEAAIRWLGQPSGIPYGETLLQVLRSTRMPPPTPFATLAIVESITQLRKRLTMIKHYEHKSPRYLLTGSLFLLVALGILLRPVRAAETPDDPQSVATGAMQSWLQELDAGKYAQSWNEAGPAFQKAVTAEKWAEKLVSVRTPLGPCSSRTLASAVRQPDLPGPTGAPHGDYILAQFDTSFDHLKYAVETVTFEKAPDGTWKAAGYYIKPKM